MPSRWLFFVFLKQFVFFLPACYLARSSASNERHVQARMRMRMHVYGTCFCPDSCFIASLLLVLVLLFVLFLSGVVQSGEGGRAEHTRQRDGGVCQLEKTGKPGMHRPQSVRKGYGDHGTAKEHVAAVFGRRQLGENTGSCGAEL